MSHRARSGLAVTALLLAATAVASLPGPDAGAPQAPATAPSTASPTPPPGSAAERTARLGPSRGAKVFYTTRFDLSDLPHYVPERQVSGTLRIYGNNYISDSPLGAWWMDGFRKLQPGITFDNYLKSAAIAVPGLYFGLADLGMNHQPSFYDLLGYLRIHGSEPLEITAVTGSYDVPGWQNTIVIMVHKDNPISKITMKQLDGVFGSARDGGWAGTTWRPEFARGPEGDIRTWGQLGLTGEWSSRRITPYGYSLRYATALEFSDKVLQSGDKWNGDLHAYGNLRRKDGTTYLEADQVIDNLRKDRYGIAYLRFHQDFPPDLKVLALADGKGGPYVDFTIENVQNRRYPLYGEQNFYASVRPGARVDPKVREFLRYVLSQEAQDMVQRDGKYLPLTAAVVRAQLRKLE